MKTALEATLPKFYRVDEVAEYLEVEAETIRKWIREGHLPAKKYGREYLIRADALESFLAV